MSRKKNGLPEKTTPGPAPIRCKSYTLVRNLLKLLFSHVVWVKALLNLVHPKKLNQLLTSIRNAELVNLTIKDVDLNSFRIRINQGKGEKDRYVLFPSNFRGELSQYIGIQKEKGAVYLDATGKCPKTLPSMRNLKTLKKS